MELVDLLAQCPRSVAELAEAAHLGMTASAHLQVLKHAGLVTQPGEPEGTHQIIAGCRASAPRLAKVQSFDHCVTATTACGVGRRPMSRVIHDN